MRLAVGAPGRGIAAVVAVGLTLAAVNAYVSGAAEMVAELRPATSARAVLLVAIGAVGVLALVLFAAGALATDRLVGLPTTLFLVVYLLCMLAAARLLRGAGRAAAVVAAIAVTGVLAFCGWPLVVAAGVAALACAAQGRIPSHGGRNWR